MKITFGEKCQKMRVSIFYIYLLHNNKVVIQNSVYRFIWSFYIELVRSAPVSLFLFRRVIEWSLIIFSHYIARTNYFLIIWWWCLLCTRGTLGSHYFQNFTLKSREREKSSHPVLTKCGEPWIISWFLSFIFHCRGVLDIAWCGQDSDLLLSCGKDNRILCWNPNSNVPGGEVCNIIFYEFPKQRKYK